MTVSILHTRIFFFPIIIHRENAIHNVAGAQSEPNMALAGMSCTANVAAVLISKRSPRSPSLRSPSAPASALEKTRVTCSILPRFGTLRTNLRSASSIGLANAAIGIQSALATDGLAVNGRLPETQFSALVPFVLLGTLYVLALGTKDVGAALMSYMKGDTKEATTEDENPNNFPRQKGMSKDISYKMMMVEREKRAKAEDDK